MRERLLSVRKRVFSTVRSRTSFAHACALSVRTRLLSQMGVCHLNQHPFMNRYLSPVRKQSSPIKPLCPSIPRADVHCWMPTVHAPLSPMHARISRRQARIHVHTLYVVHTYTRSCTGYAQVSAVHKRMPPVHAQVTAVHERLIRSELA